MELDGESVVVEEDEHPRPDTDVETLSNQVVGAPLGAAIGWPAPFVACPFVCLVGSTVFRRSRPSAIQTGERGSSWAYRAAFCNRAVLFVPIAGFCLYLLYTFLNS